MTRHSSAQDIVPDGVRNPGDQRRTGWPGCRREMGRAALRQELRCRDGPGEGGMDPSLSGVAPGSRGPGHQLSAARCAEQGKPTMPATVPIHCSRLRAGIEPGRTLRPEQMRDGIQKRLDAAYSEGTPLEMIGQSKLRKFAPDLGSPAPLRIAAGGRPPAAGNLGRGGSQLLLNSSVVLPQRFQRSQGRPAPLFTAEWSE